MRSRFILRNFFAGLMFFGLFSCVTPSFAGIEVECGFGGYIKPDTWFPFRVKKSPGAVDYEVILYSTDWNGKNEKVLARYQGAFPADQKLPGTALCRFNSSYGQTHLRCILRKSNGTIETVSVTPDLLTSGDLLILVLSDQPEEFNFLGSIDRQSRGIVRSVVCNPDAFPARWQELECVDVVILDGNSLPSKRVQQEALRQWVIAGGTVLLTDRAIQEFPKIGDLHLFDDLKSNGEYRKFSSKALRPLFGKKVDLFEGFTSLDLTAPRGQRILLSGDDTLIAGRDMGRGRVLVPGINWRDLSMKDRAVYEMMRETLWSRMLDMIRPELRSGTERELVLPPEAKLSFLAKPLGLFLIAYVLLLGPLNWLILKYMKRLEYSVFTLPIGALVFSALAFGVGVALRSSDTVLHEADYLYVFPDGSAYSDGISGVLSPDRKPYELKFRNQQTQVNELVERQRFQAPKARDVLTTAFDGYHTFSNVRIDTWSMRFFQRKTPTFSSEKLQVTGTFTSNAIIGQISNGLTSTLHNAHILFGRDLVDVGEIPSGASTNFILLLTSTNTEDSIFCPNCGCVHNDNRGRTEKFWREHPRLAVMRDLVESMNLGHSPMLIASQDPSGSCVDAENRKILWEGRRMMVALLELQYNDKIIVLPEGIITVSVMMKYENPLAAAQVSELPYRLQIMDPDALEEKEVSRRQRNSFTEFGEVDDEQYTREYFLPFEARQLETTRLTVHWDAGEVNPDVKPTEGALSLYDWGKTQWVEQVRAVSGDHRMVVEDPDRFIQLPFPVLRIKLAPVKHEKGAYCTIKTLDIAYEVTRLDDRKPVSKN